MISRKILIAFVACQLVVMAAGSGTSSAGSPGIEMKAGDFLMLSPSSFLPSCGCPDIAYTNTFRSGGLGYVASEEFADAIHAVANGSSEYSPQVIPADWRTAAESWIEYRKVILEQEANEVAVTAVFQLQDGEMFQFPKGKYACSPSLVHFASLEFIKKRRQRILTPVSTEAVHKAIKELEAIMDAKRKMAPRLAARARAIASRIKEAERMGAGDCSPGDVSRTKAELEQAFMEARTTRSAPSETVASFDRAERFADYLLSERRFASSSGGRCPE
jgi:hypothetical protein